MFLSPEPINRYLRTEDGQPLSQNRKLVGGIHGSLCSYRVINAADFFNR